MTWYKIYAGLSGGFGGAEYKGTFEFEDEDAAMNEAYEYAVDDFESYVGYHGLLDWDECKEDLIESGYEDPTEDEINDRYNEEIESWIDFYVTEAEGPDDIDED